MSDTPFEKLLWIRGKNESETRKPIFVGIYNGDMYWGAGITRCGWQPEKYTIVKEFEYVNWRSVNKVRKELLMEYAPTPQKPCARMGWVSPEGHWYPCAYCCHRDLEGILGEILYNDAYWPDLERNGWVALKGGALIVTREHNLISEEAKTTIRKIVEEFEFAESENPDINWNKILEANPEGYDMEAGWSDSTSHLLRGETYAEALRASYELWWGERNSSGKKLKIPSANGDITSKRLWEHPGD